MMQRIAWLSAFKWTLVVIAACSALIQGVGAQPASKAYLTGGCDTPQTPFCDALMPPIPNWTGHVFQLSQNYPTTSGPDAQPWLQFDPKTQPDQYLTAVLSYIFEGNIQADTESSFDPRLNAVRGWYNAPWQDVGIINGREFIHGLTRERVSRPHELAPEQVHEWNNYAVGFYNARGGMIFGRVWQDHGNPDPAAALFPNGTVATKLIFTAASEAEVPYLKGAPQWQAYVYANPNDPAPKASSPRAVLPLRLLQIDIAVKDDRVSDTTGWVFGTFVYGGGPGGVGGSGWMNVSSVGTMWGNDPGYSGAAPLAQTWLNPAVHMPHVGYQGRLNGPIDNPASSCLSCHSTAEVPSGTMVPPTGVNPASWFQNIKSGAPFDSGRQSTDYSLQLSVGIANFTVNHGSSVATVTPEQRLKQLRSIEAYGELPPRAGGSIH